MTRDELIENMARGICREKCAFMGEPPCFAVLDGTEFKWPPETCCEPGCVSEAAAALTAIEEAGMVVAPKEATDEMLNAELGLRTWDNLPSYESRRDLRPHIYRAMIAARPTASKEKP